MGFPKALLNYRGETFVDRLIGLFSRYCSPVIVVTGAHADRIRAGSARAVEAQFVVNQNWACGQITSLQCGLASVPKDSAGVLYTLVDHPAVTEDTVARLTAPGPGLLRIPRYGGRRGHPIWIGQSLLPEFLDARAGETARDIVRRHVEDTFYVDVDDPGVLADIDDAHAYRALMEGVQ